MLVEELSNHPRAMLRRSYDDEQHRVEEHRTAVEQLRARHGAARPRWWRIRARLSRGQELRSLQSRAPRTDPADVVARAKLDAGIAGEDAMCAALRFLPDDWLLFRGYANRRGEVDLLLVGPDGVWAIEVKSRGVRVHVDGDRWSFEKIRYDNVVESGVLQDRGGRGWGRQVGEVAQELERFLASRGQRVGVRTAVVLLHPAAELGICRDLRVTVFSVGTQYLIERLRVEPQALDRRTCDAVARLVRRDHAFHVARRAGRAGG